MGGRVGGRTLVDGRGEGAQHSARGFHTRKLKMLTSFEHGAHLDAPTYLPTQMKGLEFMVSMFDRGCNCILGDEMGLGKTRESQFHHRYVNQAIIK